MTDVQKFEERFRLKSILLMGCFAVSLLWGVSVQAALTIQTWTSEKGAKVLFVPSTKLPMVDMEVSFDAGSARDGSRFGLASFTGALLGTATTTLNENEINQAFDALGAQLGSNVSRDQASVSLRTLTRPNILNKSVQTFASVLSQAVFEPSIFKREQARWMLGLQQSLTRPQTVASNALWTSIYGNHPYGHPVQGTPETIKALDIAAVKRFYQTYYVAKNAVVAIVGDVSRKQAEQMANDVLSHLPAGKVPSDLPKPDALTAAKTVNIDFDSSQTYYYLAQLGEKRGDPDYAALFLGNHLLGGNGFASRLMEEVREKRGLVYSVYSYFAPMKETGPFLIGLSTKNSSATEADKVVRNTLDSFINGFSEAKFQATKENLLGGFPLRIDSNAEILGYVSLIGFYDLPLDYLSWLPKALKNTTKAQVLSAWQRRIHPDQMVEIRVGQLPPKHASSKK